MAAPDDSASGPTGLAHVATVSFLAARAAPSAQFWLALAGGIGLARAAALNGVRMGYGVSLAAILQTIAVMGPARVNAPLTQALTAPMLGALHRRGTRVPAQVAACFAIRLTHYAVLTAALVWIILGGLDAYTGSYDALTGWLGIFPAGQRGALIVTAVVNVALAVFYSVTQVLVYRWALTSWPEGAPPAVAPAAAAGEDRGSARFDPRAITLAAALAFGLLLSGTHWALLASVAAFLALAWAVSRPDPEALALGLALTALLAFGALVASLVAGLGIEEALRRGSRAGLLVLVATWLRAAAGPAGLRETFRRALWRVRWVPPAREASEILDGLDSGERLIASGRTLVDALGPVEKRPLPVAAVVRDWVAAEAAGFRAGVAAVRARLAAAPRDGLLVALAVAPALTLFAHG
ncbi:MAG: hypothetical protein QOC68_2760 [Solirubrobacteraceae bacterium]|nr:hypothetical protein [Solirubrobacteraceae bacterium]